MKDRRTTRVRSDLKNGDLVTRRKGWFVPMTKGSEIPWGVYGAKKSGKEGVLFVSSEGECIDF